MTNMIRLSGIQRGDWPDVIKMQLHGEFRDYVPERTCRNVSKSEYSFRCSECDATDLDFQYPDFCHGCGAKVVDE